MAIKFCRLINRVDDEDLVAISAFKVDDILMNCGKNTEWFNEKHHLTGRHGMIQILSLE
jgi:hypothetical protein